MSTIKNKAISLGTLSKHGAKGDSQIINIKMSVSDSTGNNIQGDGIIFDIKFNLDQIH